MQNEPEFPAPWEACAYNPAIQGDFVANHLGPILRQDHPDVKLLIFDHNKDHMVKWGTSILNSTNPASSYVDGTAVHWYAGGMDRLLDGAGKPTCTHLQSDIQGCVHLYPTCVFFSFAQSVQPICIATYQRLDMRASVTAISF